MKNIKSIAAIAALILLVGAGCQSKNKNTEPEITPSIPKTPVINTDTDTTAETIEPTTEAAELSTPADLLDETWQTYTSRDDSFSFQWPTKGRYAPQWSFDIVADDDARLADGCITTDSEPEMLKVGDTEFCHTGTLAADEKSATDYFLTTDKSGKVLITFTKDSGATVEGYSWDEYQQHLRDIISTCTVSE